MGWPLLYALLVFAAYRATRLLARDSILDKPREWLFDHFPPDGDRGKVQVDWAQWGRRPEGGAFMKPRPAPRPVSMVGQLFDCQFCCGFWVSGGLVGLVWALHPLPLPALWWPAVAGAQGMLGALDGRLTQ